MRHPTVLLALSDARASREISTGLVRFGYDNLTATDHGEALAILAERQMIDVLVIDADAPEGLALGRGVRKTHPQVAIVYASEAPQRIPEDLMVEGSPMLRAPFPPHLLAGVVAALGRRVTDDFSRRVN
jgi:DNA-binding response OmpR family regulator